MLGPSSHLSAHDIQWTEVYAAHLAPMNSFDPRGQKEKQFQLNL